MKTQDTYKEPTIFNYPGVVVRVYRPMLTEEEHAKRMTAIHKQAANLLRSAKV